MTPFRLFLTLLILPLAVLCWWLLGTEAGLRYVWSGVERVAPIKAERLSGRVTGPIRFEGLRIGTGGAEVSVARLVVDWDPLALLGGRLRLSRVEGEGVRIEVAPASGEGAPAGPPRLPSPPLLVELHGRLNDIAVVQPEGEEFRLLAVALDGVAGPRRLDLHHLSMVHPWGRMEAKGDLFLDVEGPLRLATDWLVQPPGRPPLRGRGLVEGTLAKPRFEQRLTGAVSGRVSGSVAWLGSPFAWELRAEVGEPLALAYFDPALQGRVKGRVSGSGGAGRLHGEADLLFDAPALGEWRIRGAADREARGWRLPGLTVEAAEGPARVEASGLLLTEGATEVALDLSWRSLSWPLAAQAPEEISSPAGQAALRGSLEQYRIEGWGELARAGLPGGDLRLEGEGDRNGLRLSRLAARWAEGSVTGEGSLRWDPSLSWKATLRADDLDPGEVRPDWPGRLGGSIAFEGERRGGLLHTQLSLTDLHGDLRGFPLAGRLRLESRGDLLELRELRLESGEALFSAEGSVGRRWAMQWALSIPRLEHFSRDLGGGLRAVGRVDGPREAPRLQVEGSGEGLLQGERRIAALKVDADLDLSGKVPWDIQVTAEGLRLGRALSLQRLALSGVGGPLDHRLTLDGSAPETGFHLAASGRYEGGRWAGHLAEGRLESRKAGLWEQAEATGFSVAGEESRLADWCWRRDDGALVCLSGEGGRGREWQAGLRLVAVPVDLIEAWLGEPGVRVSGSLDGSARLGYRKGVTGMAVRLQAREGRFRLPLGEEGVESGYRHLTLDLDADREGLRGASDLLLENGDHARAALAMPSWRPGAALLDQPMTGRIDLSASDLAWVSILIPDLVIPRGRLAVGMDLSGSLRRPDLAGNLLLEGGEMALPLLGISLSDLRIQARSAPDALLALSGSARSGPGRVEVSGLLRDSPEGWRLLLDVNGDRAEVIRLPQARVLATPALHLLIEPGSIRVSGSVVIPEAEIDLPEITAPVRTSPDVVLLDQPRERRQRRWKVLSEVEVVLGDRVSLKGYGFTGRLGGRLFIVEPPTGGAVGRGEVKTIDARYEAYGQILTIEEGRLLYANAPLDNPGIDFRAVRYVGEDVKVGIVVTERLRKPEVRLYSEPAMDDSQILSYLVLGRALETASREEADILQQAALSLGLAGGTGLAREIAGQFGVDVVQVQGGTERTETALVLGKYLSPRLYVQYAVGLWEAQNAFRVIYQLGGDWTLEAESGTQRSGADLLYTFER